MKNINLIIALIVLTLIVILACILANGQTLSIESCSIFGGHLSNGVCLR